MMRMKATGRDPVVVQDPLTHEFRLNRPVDDWPAVALAPRPRYTQSKAIEKIADRLRESGSGDDPATFEQTVCDAFAMMGVVARHIGGQAAPDGTLDAPLGPLGFRAILECKGAPSGRHVSNPRPEEPARFRDADGADFAVLVGAVFKDEVSAVTMSSMVHKLTRCAVSSSWRSAVDRFRRSSCLARAVCVADVDGSPKRHASLTEH